MARQAKPGVSLIPTRSKRIAIPAEWTFKNRDIADDFDRHVREQLPWYDLATSIVVHVARHYVSEAGTIIDVGASTGNIGRQLASMIEQRKARFIAIDASEEMKAVYNGPNALRIARAQDFDFSVERPDLVIAFLVLMFVPIDERASVIDRMKAALCPGGAIIVFDKIEPRGGYLGTVTSRLALAEKLKAGAEPSEVLEKELSLAGHQRPLSEVELQGFVEVFRFGDFAGYVYEAGVI